MTSPDHTPLSAADLEAIRERLKHAQEKGVHGTYRTAELVEQDIPRLLAELERLRENVTPLLSKSPIVYITDNGGNGWGECAYCEDYYENYETPPRPMFDKPHAADCPWLKAREALGIAKTE